MGIIVRENYVARIEKELNKDRIVVLTGQRRVGKSQMLKLMKMRLEEQPNANVIYIDKEKREFDAIKTYVHLNQFIAERIAGGMHNYILIDEVQDIEEFEKSVRSWNTEPDTDVIVTGSNAHMLSSELSTIIGGRYKEIRILPLNYMEFLEFHQLENGDDSLMKYINYGGMPGLRNIGFDDEDDVFDFLADIYSTVLLKDVVMRNQIRNISFLEDLAHFMSDSTGKLISASSICKYMRSQGVSITPTSLIEYLRFLSEAYIINKVNRYDIHGKRILESNDKYYFSDHGIRNAIAGGSREGDIEKVLENIVYNHLVGLGYNVYVGKLQNGEIDFVCNKSNGSRIYIQVSYVIADDATREREFGNLRSIPDNYSKYVISLTPMVSKSDNDGITHLHLRRFLTEGI